MKTNTNHSNTKRNTDEDVTKTLEENANIEGANRSNNNESIKPDKNNSQPNNIELNQQIDEYKNKYLRTLAELENIKKYSNKQLEEANSYAINKFAKELLTVMDIFNKALTSLNKEQINDPTFKAFISGIELTHQELCKIFKKFHIVTLDSSIVGEQFNPVYHEALMSKEDSEKPNNSIFEVFEPGYIIKEKLLRPAKVGIIKNS